MAFHWISSDARAAARKDALFRVRSWVVVLAVVAGCSPKSPAPRPPESEGAKTLYALGASLARGLEALELTPSELELVQQGLADSVLKRKPAVGLEEFDPKVHQLFRARAAARAQGEKERGLRFLAEAAKAAGAQRLSSGIIYSELAPGSGDPPAATDRVSVHYRGTLASGAEFDSSFKRGQPAQFSLGQVIRCWTEGLQKMKPGGKAKLVCPAETAYGDRGSPPAIPGGATLVFEVELLEVVKDAARQ